MTQITNDVEDSVTSITGEISNAIDDARGQLQQIYEDVLVSQAIDMGDVPLVFTSGSKTYVEVTDEVRETETLKFQS